MVSVATARANVVAQIVDGSPGSITPSKLRPLLTDLIDALDAEVPFSKLDAMVAPTANDDSADTLGNGVFAVGSLWIDASADRAYRCVDATTATAVWIETTLSTDDLGALSLLNTVSATEIDADAVTTAKILDANVTAAKLAATAVTPGTYTLASITVDQQGRLTSAESGSSDGAVNKYDATTAPTANDDDANTSTNGVFSVGSEWVDVTADKIYQCVDATATAAVWREIIDTASTQTMADKTLTSPVLNTGVSGTAVKDEDNMSSNSATHLATQQSIKAYVDANRGKVAQVVHAVTGAVVTGTTTVPFDDTIPQNTEGNEMLTCSITPTNAGSTLLISSVMQMGNSAGSSQIMALFKDSAVGALAVAWNMNHTGSAPVAVMLEHSISAGSTSAQTFKIRCGSSAAGTQSINGVSGARYYGGKSSSTITIIEILP